MPNTPHAGCRPFGAAPAAPACRCCGLPTTAPLVDLGLLPVSGTPVEPDAPDAARLCRPLRPLVCDDCRLVQLAGPAAPGPASRRTRRPRVARRAAAAMRRLGLDAPGEVAVLDADGPSRGTFLCDDLPVRGLSWPFGAAEARRLLGAGHAPVLLDIGDAISLADDLHDLLEGCRILLAPGGVLFIEVPHLLPVLRDRRLDAFRHDRRAWFTLATVEIALLQHGLVVFDAEEVAADGGWLRVQARHVENRGRPLTQGMAAVRAREAAFGLQRAAPYRAFAEAAVQAKCDLLDFLVGMRRAGRRVVGLVAPGQGDTLLGYAGVGPELLPVVADLDAARHGGLLPGARIPIRSPAAALAQNADFLLVLTWDGLAVAERAFARFRAEGGRFVLPTPVLHVV
ncbi:hypothetical protein [Falsiroseomonas oryzae]|uniref:hypothetical protein n=1 Tax=Falsiroseomonas oryzae TaxID=2766473 RepID=UPI0022EAEFF9|nr:hypothetical protein [Roseomonas sp. MO-31]